jgi:SAM-dependent methyltransferase
MNKSTAESTGSPRERCWCGGRLTEFAWHAEYGVCASCGCYVSRRSPSRSELRELYSFDGYWHSRQLAKGNPAIESRTRNDLTDGRVAFWLGLIAEFAPSTGRAVEVGCAHGVLLTQLATAGWAVVGVEPDEATAAWTAEATGVDVRAGLFPDVELPGVFDLFLAFDVIEHSPDPARFMRGAADLLRSGGIAIIQTPIDRYGTQPPFAERFKDAFDPEEHLFLFTNRAMEQLAEASGGLRIVDSSRRLWLHHEICILAKEKERG